MYALPAGRAGSLSRSCLPRRQIRSRMRGCRSVRPVVRRSANEFRWSWWSLLCVCCDLDLILAPHPSEIQGHKASDFGTTRTDSAGQTSREVDLLGPVLGVGVVTAPGHEGGDLGTAGQIELHEDVAHVVLDGLLGEMNALADLAVRHPFGDEADDAALLRG